MTPRSIISKENVQFVWKTVTTRWRPSWEIVAILDFHLDNGVFWTAIVKGNVWHQNRLNMDGVMDKRSKIKFGDWFFSLFFPTRKQLWRHDHTNRITVCHLKKKTYNLTSGDHLEKRWPYWNLTWKTWFTEQATTIESLIKMWRLYHNSHFGHLMQPS